MFSGPANGGDERTIPPHGDVARDAALAAGVRAGEVDALRAVMAAYWESLVTLATIVTGSPDLAREAVQDVFVQLWDARETIDPQRSLAGYLRTLAYRRARDVARHEHVHERLVRAVAAQADRAAHVATNAGENAVETEELRARLDAVLAELPPRCREVFLLHRQSHLSYDEIQSLLGISYGTIANYVSRALQAVGDAVASWRATG